jgi:hypothetical protein
MHRCTYGERDWLLVTAIRLWSVGGVTLTEDTEVEGEKAVPVPLCPAQISHGLVWD